MIDPRRRSFLAGRPAAATPAPRPPWARRPDDAFTAACTRCGDCIRACPREVLTGGDGGFVEIRFAQAGCSLCGECARVCATGAIARANTAEPFSWRVQVDSNCLTRHGVECRVCGEACDTRALRFVPARGGIAQLQIDTAACTGCGDCVGVCPVTAIRLA